MNLMICQFSLKRGTFRLDKKRVNLTRKPLEFGWRWRVSISQANIS